MIAIPRTRGTIINNDNISFRHFNDSFVNPVAAAITQHTVVKAAMKRSNNFINTSLIHDIPSEVQASCAESETPPMLERLRRYMGFSSLNGQ